MERKDIRFPISSGSIKEVTIADLEILVIEDSLYLDEVKPLLDNLALKVPVPKSILDRTGLIMRYPELFRGVVRFGIMIASSNEEMVDILRAFTSLLDRFGDKMKGVGLAEIDDEPAFIHVVMDCGEEEWNEALKIVFKHPHAKKLNVLCEKALFGV
ncbi:MULTISPECIES: hypothetical protein [Metallosphaera]|uniref:hypothetical protein n=1 Tax=Metallosphaera TaxID=41980 RepID=UPI001EE01A58|nr:hypothetical protein [Metallosphaera javensis (ex Hofmann et al. 2022)]